MKELVGMRCELVFNLPALEWPIPGYPAWVDVEAVDMPMVKLNGLWVNVSTFKTIRAWKPSVSFKVPWWARLLSGPSP
jgi:hypothetical protein